MVGWPMLLNFYRKGSRIAISWMKALTCSKSLCIHLRPTTITSQLELNVDLGRMIYVANLLAIGCRRSDTNTCITEYCLPIASPSTSFTGSIAYVKICYCF